LILTPSFEIEDWTILRRKDEPRIVPMISPERKNARLRSPTAQRQARRQSDFRCAASGSLVVWVMRAAAAELGR